MLFNDQLYGVMKKVVQLGLPGASTLYFTLALIWGLPNADKVSGTLAAVAVFLGALLGFSSKTYRESPERFDGTLMVEEDAEGDTTLRFKNLDVKALDSKDSLVLKMQRPPTV